MDRALPADDVLPEALAYARRLAERCSPAAMATIKSQLRSDSACTFDVARDRAFSLMLEAFEHPDQREGALAFAERRQPQFAALDA